MNNICTNISEHPIYKVRVWKSATDFETFVFVGKSPPSTRKVLDKIESGKKLTKADEVTLKNHYGNGYATSLVLHDKNTKTFINEQLCYDDNINTMRRKVSSCIFNGKPENDLYFWMEREVKNTMLFQQNISTHLLKGRKYVSKKNLVNFFETYLRMPISSSEASLIPDKVTSADVLRVLSNSKITTTHEPLGIRLLREQYQLFVHAHPFQNLAQTDESEQVEIVSDRSRTLEHFKLKNNTIHAAQYEDVKIANPNIAPLYFHWHEDNEPKVDEKLAAIFKTSSDVYNEVIEKINALADDKFAVDCHINFLHIRVNEASPMEVQLDKLFDVCYTTTTVPFIKHKDAFTNVYKADKQAMVHFSKDDFALWTEQTTTAKGKSAQEYVMFKVFVKQNSDAPCYATVMVYSDFHIDIKYQVKSADDLTLSEVTASFQAINALLKTVGKAVDCPHESYLVEPNFWNKPHGFTSTKLVNMASYVTVVSKESNPDLDKLTLLANSLFPFVNVLAYEKEKEKLLSFQYKRIDNFIKTDNITTFMNQNYSMGQELVAKLQEVFGITMDEAVRNYEHWSHRQKLEMVPVGMAMFFRPASTGNVVVKVKKSSLGIKAHLEGVTNMKYHKRLVGFLKFLLQYSSNAGLSSLSFIKQIADKQARDLFDDEAFADDDFSDEKGLAAMEDMLDDDNNMDMLADYDNAELYQGDYNEYELKLDMDFGDLNLDDDDQDAQDDANDNDEEADIIKKLRGTKGSDNKIVSQYVLNKLKSADRKLFYGNNYSTKCQWSNKRQPIVITPEDKARIDSSNASGAESYDNNFIAFGTNPNKMKNNLYICPEIWCPISRVSMTHEQYVKNGNKCPAKDEPVIDMTQKYWMDEKKKTRKQRFVGFAGDGTQCLPCCFSKPPKYDKKGVPNENRKKIDQCLATDNEEPIPSVKVHVNEAKEKYIVGTQFPLDANRYGILPKVLSDMFKNTQCGNGGEGTGLITEGTNCFLRKGIHQRKGQSFLSCMNALLFDGTQDMSEMIKKHLTLQDFLTLNEGGICGMFLNPKKTIYDPEEFKAFRKWFMAKNDYIVAFNLYDVKHDIEEHSGKGFTTVTRSSFKNFRAVLREYLIYNSYQNFIAYIDDNNVEKLHNIVLDVFNRETNALNPDGYNIIVFEMDKDEVFMSCPYNTKAKLDLSREFVFVIKQDDTYEPIIHVAQSSGSTSVKTQSSFEYGHNKLDSVTSIVDFYRRNCAIKKVGTSASAMITYLKTLGHNIRFQVLNYNYRVVGFVLQKTGLFVPISHDFPVLLDNAKFIYQDELVEVLKKKTPSYQSAKDLFGALYNLVGNDMYKIAKVAYKDGDAASVIGLVMVDGTNVPLDMSSLPQEHYLDNLNIFVGWDEDDERTRFVRDEEYKTVVYKVLKNELIKYFTNNETMKQELEFIRSVDNPFPAVIRKQRLSTIIKSFIKHIAFPDEAIASDEVKANVVKNGLHSCAGVRKHVCAKHDTCEWHDDKCMMKIQNKMLLRFESKLVDLFSNRGSHLKLEAAVKHQPPADQIEFSHKDIVEGKVAKLMSILRNPYTYIDKVVDDYVKDIVEAEIKVRKTINLKTVLAPNEWRKLPVDFNKMFNGKPDFECGNGFCINEQAVFTRSYLLEAIICIGKLQNNPIKLSTPVIQKFIDNAVVRDYQKGPATLVGFLCDNNPSFKFLKGKRTTELACDDVLAIMHKPEYCISEYEIGVMSELLNAKIFVLARKGIRNPNRFKCFKPSRTTKKSVILFRTTEEPKKEMSFDRYELVAYSTSAPQILYSDADHPEVFAALNQACIRHYVVNDVA
jgi:hypothetical protein